MKYKFTLSLLTLVGSMLSTQAMAQATVKDDGQWRSAFALGLSSASGNTSATTLSLMGDAVRATKQDKWSIYGSALYGRSAGVTTANLMRAGTRYDWNLNDRTFAFGGLDLTKDAVADLSLRTGLSAGLGYYLIKDAVTTFDIFGGVGYTLNSYSSTLYIAGANRSSYNYANLLLGEESTHKLTDTISAKQKLVLYPNLNDHGQYLATFDAGLSAALSKTTNVTAGLVVRENSDPGAGIKHMDSILTVGVGMKFD